MRDVSVDGGVRLDADLLPWEQQPGESNEQWAAFRRYCRLARRVNPKSGEPLPRNLSDMAEDVKWSVRHLRRIAHQFRWVERADAWDVDREAELGGKIADARLQVMRDRLDLLAEMRTLTLGVLRDKDPEEWKVRDVIELLKVQLVAEDNLLGIAQRGASYNGVGVGVDISLPVGESTSVIEGQLDEILGEIAARKAGVSSSGVVDVEEVDVGD
jgi:hypothetical protein